MTDRQKDTCEKTDIAIIWTGIKVAQSQDLNPKKTAKNRKVTIKAKYVYV